MVFRSYILQNFDALELCNKKIFNIPRFSHITPVLHSWHWLPVKFRIEFKIMFITFKAIYGLMLQVIFVNLLISMKVEGTTWGQTKDSSYKLQELFFHVTLTPNRYIFHVIVIDCLSPCKNNQLYDT